MAISQVGTPVVTHNYVGGTTQTVSFTASSGNAVVVFSDNTATSVTDNLGGTYTNLYSGYVWGKASVSGSVTSVTLTFASSSITTNVGVIAYSGVSSFGNTNAGSFGSGSTYSLSNSLTAGGNYNLLFATEQNGSALTPTATAGTRRAYRAAAYGNIWLQDNTSVSSGSLAVSGTLSPSSSGGGSMNVVELKGAGGTPGNVTVTGFSSTGSVGAATASGAASKTVAGFSATGSIGTVSAGVSASVNVSGMSATGSVGTLAATGAAAKTITGVLATGAIGAITSSGSGEAAVSGFSATGTVGLVTAWGASIVTLLGFSAIGSVGNTTELGGAAVSVSGLSAIGAIGTVTATGSGAGMVTITGFAAVGFMGAVVASGGQTGHSNPFWFAIP